MSNEDLEKRIIAVMEFHGWKLLGNGRGQYMRPKVDGLNCPMLLSGAQIFEHTYYHTSYDWLMPVWAKFRALKFPAPHTDEWVNGEGLYMEHSGKCDVIRSAITDSDSPMNVFIVLSNAIIWYQSIKK